LPFSAAELKPLRVQYSGRFARCQPYADDIDHAVKRWWALYPYPKLWAAQLFQESQCNPLAQSPVGAAGLAQFMPATWADVSKRLNLPPGSSPHDRIAINAGAMYMAQLASGWTSHRAPYERQRWAQGSYNWGMGNMLRAQRQAGGATTWNGVRAFLPNETRTYVERIERWTREMGGCQPLQAAPELQREMGC
jgi:membrane-bound lytic murein transglycosylase MltF